MWIRKADLPRLRSWAIMANPVWAKGIIPAAQQAKQNYDGIFFPGGNPATPFPDKGSINFELYDCEAYAQFFAFMSLVDNDPKNRDDYAARAKRLLLYVCNEAVKGVAENVNGLEVPFRSRMFGNFNRANYWGEAFGLTVDWIYSYLDSNEKDLIRRTFLLWSSQMPTSYPMSVLRWFPMMTGTYDNPSLLGKTPDAQYSLRWVANNYYSGHARNMTLMALAFDEADDPPLDQAAAPVLKLGNSMRSWVRNLLGGWLYQQYAVFEDSAKVYQDYNLNGKNLAVGVASGGIPVEGSLYGFSVGMIFQELLAFYTAGYLDSSLYGPQTKLINSSFWDKYIEGFLHTIAPLSKMPNYKSYNYMGKIYEMAAFGDLLRFWVTPEDITSFGPIAAYDIITNNQERLNKIRWIGKYTLQGCEGKFLDRVSNIWGNCNATNAIFYFMMYDPATNSDTDPRSDYPTDFFQKPIGRVLSRTDWSPDAAWFTYLANWQTINHQNSTAGQFEFYRKGEWLTKEWSGYGNNAMETPEMFNTLSIKNEHVKNVNWFESSTDSLGGQWTNGMSNGDPYTIASFGTNYTNVQSDLTQLYNSRNAQDLQHASRSIVWVKPDNLFIYDRIKTKVSGRFKRFNMVLTELPEINEKNASITTAKGQKLYYQNIFPENAVVTERHNWLTDPFDEYHNIGEDEICKYRIVVEDTAADMRFFNCLQSTDAGGIAPHYDIIKSSNFSNFEGILVDKKYIVLFPRYLDDNGDFEFLLSLRPDNILFYIAGMKPNTPYLVNYIYDGLNYRVNVKFGAGIVSDSTGLLSGQGIPQKRKVDVNEPSDNNSANIKILNETDYYSNSVIFEISGSSEISCSLYDLIGNKVMNKQLGFFNKGSHTIELSELMKPTDNPIFGFFIFKLSNGKDVDFKRVIQ
ncbi:MAG: hypothetical protein NT007_04620 [Candidatus Kapabacteria bacterium]|nr:hypothetical protein [Candidatus Kapabacteria bacterium]